MPEVTSKRKKTMTTSSTRPLPDYNGAVVRIPMEHDGVLMHGVGMLNWDDDCENLVWYRAGYDEPVTAEKWASLMEGRAWEVLTTRPTDA